MKVDMQVKANLDRIDRRKMNRARRVQSLPEKGGDGDWVVVSEQREVAGEAVSVDVSYVWIEGAWTSVGGDVAVGAQRQYHSRFGG